MVLGQALRCATELAQLERCERDGRDAELELGGQPFDVSSGVDVSLEPGEYELVTASVLSRWTGLTILEVEQWVVFPDARVERRPPGR